jgi:hypothetical protein
MLDQKFIRAQQEFARLKASFEAGTLSGEDFETALRGLTFEHGGRQWTIGATSGKWFASSGDSWVEATPPSAGAGIPEHAPPAPPPGSTPHHPVGPTAGMSAAVRMTLMRWGAVLLFVGAGSFVLPLIGMQFQLLNLFGEENQQPAAVIMMIVGGIMLFIGRSGGNVAAGQTQAPATPAAASAQPKQSHFLIGAIVIGALALLWYYGSGRGSTPSASDTQTAPAQEQTSSAPAVLPPCPQGYTPPAPQLGTQPAPTCDASAQSSPPP